VLRPLSSGRFRALSFDSVFFLAVQKENEETKGFGLVVEKRAFKRINTRYFAIFLAKSLLM
jgi:hypothetical protein